MNSIDYLSISSQLGIKDALGPSGSHAVISRDACTGSCYTTRSRRESVPISALPSGLARHKVPVDPHLPQ